MWRIQKPRTLLSGAGRDLFPRITTAWGRIYSLVLTTGESVACQEKRVIMEEDLAEDGSTSVPVPPSPKNEYADDDVLMDSDDNDDQGDR